MTTITPGGALELHGVTKRYGTGTGGQVTAADNITLSVESGAFVALTGASGSGKSTLLHMIGALERPDAGTIISNGTEVTALRGAAQADYRRTVGFVFQRYNLLPGLTALDNVIAPVLPYRTRWDKRARARELLAAVGLAGREHSLPSRMSGGEQQRIAIARALINTPALLLADEPTGNLDTANATEILDLLARMRADHPVTILLASHDPQIAARADRLIRLRDGTIIDDIPLTADHSVDDIIRHISQLGLPSGKRQLTRRICRTGARRDRRRPAAALADHPSDPSAAVRRVRAPVHAEYRSQPGWTPRYPGAVAVVRGHPATLPREAPRPSGTPAPPRRPGS
jgi:putative ABC transport system ATP-binding protein